MKNLEGDWKLKLFEVDGIDSTMLTTGASTIPDYIDNFAHIGSFKSKREQYITMTNHYRYFNVDLDPKHEFISFTGGSSSGFDSSDCAITNSQLCQRNIFNPKKIKTFAWKIQKLTKAEMILLSESYNYKLILTKK